MNIAEHLFLVPLDTQIRRLGGSGLGGAIQHNVVSPECVSIKYQFVSDNGRDTELVTRNEVTVASLRLGGNKVEVVLNLDRNTLVAYEIAERKIIRTREIGSTRSEADMLLHVIYPHEQVRWHEDICSLYLNPTVS